MKNFLKLFFIFIFNFSFGQNPGDTLFSTPIVHEIKMYFPQTNYWDSLTYYYNQINITGNKTYMKTDSVIIDGNILPNVGVRLKGNSAYNWAIQLPSVKLPFKLDFDKYISGQKLDGLKKLNLHNEDRDPSIMRSKIIADFLLQQGVYSPRITYSKVFINDVYWGLYTIVEQIDKTFLQSNFGDNNGNLYKALPRYPFWEAQGGSTLEWMGNSGLDYDNIYELKTNSTLNDWSGFVNLLNQTTNTSMNEFKDSLESVMNTDSYLKTWAIMSILFNHDSYPSLGNNFYLYHNPTDNKFHWIAWDYNLGIATLRQGLTITQAEHESILAIRPSIGNKPLGNRMLDNAYYYNRYLAWVCLFTQELSDTSIINAKIDSIANAIRTDVYADTNKFYSNIDFEENQVHQIYGIPGIKPFISNRINAILNELNVLGCPTVNINEDISTNFILFPNPFNTTAVLLFDNTNNKKYTLTVFDSFGRIVNKHANITRSQYIIRKGYLKEGLYLFQLVCDENIILGKFLIQ